MPIMRMRALLPVAAAGVLASLVAACTTTPPVPDPAAPAAELHLDATIKDLMLGVVDTNADVVWNAVSFVNSDQGMLETRPTNDEEWATTRVAAVALMEAGNLLKMHPRKVALAHEKSVVPGIELEPAEMEANIARDPAAWDRHAEDFYAAAKNVLAAIEARDVDKVFMLGATIEHACEGCHKAYWYPNEVIPEIDFSNVPPVGQAAPAQAPAK
jgi:hypothetical protein